MQITCASSAATDTVKALDEIYLQSGRSSLESADFIALHASANHDIDALNERFAGPRRTGLHGGTSCLGVMTNAGVVSDQGFGLGLFMIHDPEGSYGTGMAAIDTSARDAARKAVRRALEEADRQGEAPDLVWLTTSPGTEEDVLRGISEEIGESVPVVGGSAADNDITGSWKIFDGLEIFSGGVIVSALYPSRPLSSAYQSGYAPTERTGSVTSSIGRRIYEIDGRAAVDVYAEWTGHRVLPPVGEEPVMILSESTFSPLGRRTGEVAEVPFYLLAHPATAHPDGSIELFADIAEGEDLTLMHGAADSLISRAGRVASFAASSGRIPKGDVAGALVVYCGGCMLAVRERMDEVAVGIDEALGGAPFLGIFTFGEQGPILDGQNVHGNLMISCVTFSR